MNGTARTRYRGPAGCDTTAGGAKQCMRTDELRSCKCIRSPRRQVAAQPADRLLSPPRHTRPPPAPSLLSTGGWAGSQAGREGAFLAVDIDHQNLRPRTVRSHTRSACATATTRPIEPSPSSLARTATSCHTRPRTTTSCPGGVQGTLAARSLTKSSTRSSRNSRRSPAGAARLSGRPEGCMPEQRRPGSRKLDVAENRTRPSSQGAAIKTRRPRPRTGVGSSTAPGTVTASIREPSQMRRSR
jgi:hypothetical protein